MATTSTTTQQEDWARSDKYHNAFLVRPDEALKKAVANSAANELPNIAVSEAQGKLLNLVARSIGAKRILEVGTLGGYSTIWLAKALPDDGLVISAELLEKHAKIVDNVVRRGKVGNPDYTDDSVEGVRNLLKGIKDDDEVDATTIATVGEKGYDGFLYAFRK